ncbi:MAG: DUF1549 domain-containing protein, partial [Bryobacteraceae bacterium]
MKYAQWSFCFVAFVTPLAAADWTALRIVPQNISLAKTGELQHFIVLARDAGGQEEDVTTRCAISSSAPETVSLDRTQRTLIGKQRGQAQITAELQGLRGTTSVVVGDRASEVEVRFSPDVISVLTIKGCNSSGCHGSPAGQNGFKLSLFGYDTAADREMIVNASGGRRVDLGNPEQSLLLRKPTFAIPHGGGRLIATESEEYKTLLKWLQQGARLDSGGARLQKLEIYPNEQVLLGKGAKLSAVVIGRLSDGSTRDMTREVRYSSSDETVAGVSSDGTITAGESGLTTILARGLGGVAASQIGVILTRAGADFPKSTANNFVDELVYEKLRKLNVRPAALCSDREFIRRVFFDTIGLPPTPEEVERFVAEPRPDKRAQLIDALLQRPEYASFWTVRFEDWFRNNQLNSQGRSMGKFKEWLSEWLAEDKPYDEIADITGITAN